MKMGRAGRYVTLAGLVLAVSACAPVDDTIGSRLVQPPPNSPPRKPVDAGDIAIVGQEVSHAILQLPEIANASVPPLVRFNGVTSIIKPPIDTEPYTELLRDRLLLLTREKLRFQEHTLPPLNSGKKKAKGSDDSGSSASSELDYQILAEMRGRADEDSYRIQIQFVDIHSNQVLFDELYNIRKEDDSGPAPSESPQPTPPEAAPQAAPEGAPPPSAPIAPTSPTL
jgi:hypothetical protein